MATEVATVELNDLQPNSPDNAIQTTQPTLPEVPRSRATIIILQLTAITLLTSTINGLLTVSIPRIASDLGIQPQLYFW